MDDDSDSQNNENEHQTLEGGTLSAQNGKILMLLFKYVFTV